MRRFLQLGTLGLLIASQVHAAELANLRNGFSIRHQRHETAGTTTRLYMDAAPGQRVYRRSDCRDRGL